MDEREQRQRLAEYERQWLDECRGRRFVRATFARHPSLRSIEPQAWDEQESYHVSSPYTGQKYNPENFEVVEDGWDHEHCHVCHARIEPGDEYWQSAEPHPLELCLACYQRLTTGRPNPALRGNGNR
jgi:hypothetical protein